ncbi:MAG: hypothetical protein R3251_02700 [Candidatus Spechtbacterales bacterium]|nr:hypothetical protein [Candidatus Spechtbacterales bacterium]
MSGIAKPQQVEKFKEFLENLECVNNTCGQVEIIPRDRPDFIWGKRVLQIPLPWDDTFEFRDLIVSQAQNWARKRNLYTNGYIHYLSEPLLLLTLKYNTPQ